MAGPAQRRAAIILLSAAWYILPTVDYVHLRQTTGLALRWTAGAGAFDKQKADRRRPADVMRALHLCLSGQADQAQQWVPRLATCAAACVRRTVDVLAFYECIASSSGGPSTAPCSSSILSCPMRMSYRDEASLTMHGKQH